MELASANPRTVPAWLARSEACGEGNASVVFTDNNLSRDFSALVAELRPITATEMSALMGESSAFAILSSRSEEAGGCSECLHS